MDDLEGDELVVLLLDGAAEVQAGVSANRTEQESKFEAFPLTVQCTFITWSGPPGPGGSPR